VSRQPGNFQPPQPVFYGKAMRADAAGAEISLKPAELYVRQGQELAVVSVPQQIGSVPFGSTPIMGETGTRDTQTSVPATVSGVVAARLSSPGGTVAAGQPIYSLIDPTRVLAVEAGACPHTVIREDPTLNMAAGDELERSFPGLELIIFESGGDNLASTFSLDLVDWWIFVIDVAGGDDIPRKRGPGVLQCDLLVVNKVDLAPHVGVDLALMLEQARAVRAGRPLLATNARSGEGIGAVADAIGHAVLFHR